MGLSTTGIVALVFMASFLCAIPLAVHFLSERRFHGRID